MPSLGGNVGNGVHVGGRKVAVGGKVLVKVGCITVAIDV